MTCLLYATDLRSGDRDLVKLLPAHFAIKLAEIHAGFCDLFNLSD
jgi:hypothetical protein